MNYAHTDAEITTFVNTYGVNYRVARVADDSGYTVPMYGTVFAIGRDGRLLWTGNATLVTDEMVESWVATPPAGEDDKEQEEGCAAGSHSSRVPPVAMLMFALAVLGVGRISRRRSATACRIRQNSG